MRKRRQVVSGCAPVTNWLADCQVVLLSCGSKYDGGGFIEMQSTLKECVPLQIVLGGCVPVQVSLQRVLGFVKRLSTVSLQLTPGACLAVLSTVRKCMLVSPETKCVEIAHLPSLPSLPSLPLLPQV